MESGAVDAENDLLDSDLSSFTHHRPVVDAF